MEIALDGHCIRDRSERSALATDAPVTTVSPKSELVAPLDRDCEQSPVATALAGSSWPASIVGLGPRHVDAFTPCGGCGHGTWVRYGTTPYCLGCALAASRDVARPSEHGG